MDVTRAKTVRMHRAMWQMSDIGSPPTVGDMRDFLAACDEQGIGDGTRLQRDTGLYENGGNPFQGLFAERVVELPR